MTTPNQAEPYPDGRPRHTVGLLEQITATSLDEDYEHVASRRRVDDDPDDPSEARARPRSVPLLAVLAVFGLLLTTAAVQTTRGASSQQRSRDSLVQQVQERRAELSGVRDDLRDLRRGITRATQTQAATEDQLTDVRQRVQLLTPATGQGSVTGPGVRITVDDR